MDTWIDINWYAELNVSMEMVIWRWIKIYVEIDEDKRIDMDT